MWTMTPSRKAGGIPGVSTRFGPSVENEQADAGRDDGSCLAGPNSQARTGTGKNQFPCSVDHEQDSKPYPVDPYSAEVLTIDDLKGFNGEELVPTVRKCHSCTSVMRLLLHHRVKVN